MAKIIDLENTAELGLIGLALVIAALPFIIIYHAWRYFTRHDY